MLGSMVGEFVFPCVIACDKPHLHTSSKSLGYIQLEGEAPIALQRLVVCIKIPCCPLLGGYANTKVRGYGPRITVAMISTGAAQ